MEDKTSIILLLSFLSLSFLTSQTNAKTQTHFMSSIYKFGKLNSKIERSNFNDLHEPQVYPEEGVRENDRIERLPGQPRPRVEFEQYGGYITVDRKAGRALYYYFVEAHHPHNSSLPLLLWLNGGPGCSSLGYGAMEELGPFHVHSDGKTLYNNPFSWNLVANVLFVESPAGVGFSYSKTSTDSETNGDRRTAIDNHAFLVNWLERFPEYKSRDFYIAGESYGGYFVPRLAHTILYHNRHSNTTSINLKGLIIGNGLINFETDVRGMYEYYGSHAIVSDEITDRIMKICDFSPGATSPQDECIEAMGEANDLINGIIDDYNIYAPRCLNPSLTQYPNKASVLDKDPCSECYIEAYLNRHEVQRALHANVTNIPYPWQLCSNKVLFGWKDGYGTVLPHLKEFMANGLRLWLYSGDIDGNVPVTSTKNSIKELKLPIKTSWRPWFQQGNYEVGGYTQVYKGDLTFATVRGAGHEVPSYQPARALSIIKYFLAGFELPPNSH